MAAISNKLVNRSIQPQSEPAKLVGDRQLYRLLSLHFPEVQWRLDPRTGTDKDPASRFVRDEGLLLHDRTFLMQNTQNLKPRSAYQFEKLLQMGVLSPLHHLAEELEEEPINISPFSFRRGMDHPEVFGFKPVIKNSSIDGGNAILFKNSRGEPSAIIGLSSLVFTLLLNIERGTFRQIEPIVGKVQKLRKAPSLEAWRLSRNWNEYQKRIPLLAPLFVAYELWKSEKKNRQATLQSIRSLKNRYNQLRGESDELASELFAFSATPVDKSGDPSDAWRFEAMLHATKEIISQDLNIPLNQIAFVYQREFHIDMEMFLATRQHLFIHLANEATQLQSHLFKLNEKRVKKIGVSTIPIQGIYKINGVILNFMNGLVLQPKNQEPVFITNGAPKHFDSLQQKFRKALAPYLQVEFIGDGFLTQLLTTKHGGLRCLTQEM